MGLRKVIPEGGVYPKGYGVAWDDYRWGGPAEVVCYPVPLNVVLGVLRKAFLWCRRGVPWRYSELAYLRSRVKRLEIELTAQKNTLELERGLNREYILRLLEACRRYEQNQDGEGWKGED